jgi:hypothetical protein
VGRALAEQAWQVAGEEPRAAAKEVQAGTWALLVAESLREGAVPVGWR